MPSLVLVLLGCLFQPFCSLFPDGGSVAVGLVLGNDVSDPFMGPTFEISPNLRLAPFKKNADFTAATLAQHTDFEGAAFDREYAPNFIPTLFSVVKQDYRKEPCGKTKRTDKRFSTNSTSPNCQGTRKQRLLCGFSTTGEHSPGHTDSPELHPCYS